MRRIIEFWVAHGVRAFRIDNPHTKPVKFWAWLIREVQDAHPDVIFLAEAFTRPKMMKALAKAGFTQSYTYFTWRNEKRELIDYLTEITTPPVADFLRGHLWPNTPDILHATLQQGGPPVFKLRQDEPRAGQRRLRRGEPGPVRGAGVDGRRADRRARYRRAADLPATRAPERPLVRVAGPARLRRAQAGDRPRADLRPSPLRGRRRGLTHGEDQRLDVPAPRVEVDEQPVLIEEDLEVAVLADVARVAPAVEDELLVERAGLGVEPEVPDDVLLIAVRGEEPEVHGHPVHAHRRLRALVDPLHRVVAVDLLRLALRRLPVARAHDLHRGRARHDQAPLGRRRRARGEREQREQARGDGAQCAHSDTHLH